MKKSNLSEVVGNKDIDQKFEYLQEIMQDDLTTELFKWLGGWEMEEFTSHIMSDYSDDFGLDEDEEVDSKNFEDYFDDYIVEMMGHEWTQNEILRWQNSDTMQKFVDDTLRVWGFSDDYEEMYESVNETKKSSAAKMVLQLMDSDEDADYEGSLKKALEKFKDVDKAELEKELDLYI